MKRVLKLIVLMFLAITSILPISAQELGDGTELVLYPVPRDLEIQDGSYTLGSGSIKTDNESLSGIKKLQDDATKYAGATLQIGDSDPVITFSQNNSLDDQGYSLVISDDGVDISYKDDAGSKYAAITLYQIMFQKGKDLPKLTITNDHPDFQYRGFMVDISRNRMPKVETLKKIIDIGESLKMNQLFLYFEGFSYAYTKHPDVWEGTDPLTPEQAKEVDNYAISKDIEVIPVQNSFGHSATWVNYMPEYGDKPGSDVLNIFNLDTQDLLRSIYDDLDAGFSTDKLVICGDETYNIDPVNGAAAKGWKEKFPDRGEPTAADLYLDSMDIINDIAGDEKGRQVMYWADMIVNHGVYNKANEVMEDAIIMDWGYTETYDFESHAQQFKKYGIPFYVCPGDNSWQTIVGYTSKTNKNAEIAAEAGKNHGAIGYMMTNWGDQGHYQNLITQIPAIAYAGGLSWNYDGSKNTEGSSENAYDPFLNTFVYQDTTNTLSQAFSTFADMGRTYNIGSFNDTYLAGIWTEGPAGTYWLDTLIDTRNGYTMDDKRDEALAVCESISNDADKLLEVLNNSKMICEDKDIYYKEFANTIQQVKVATDFASMRLRLYDQRGITPVSNEKLEQGQAEANLAYFEEMINDFIDVWNTRDQKHLLDNTLNNISKPRDYYEQILGIGSLEDTWKPISDDNLFIITADTIEDGVIEADDLVSGFNWAEAGDRSPSLVYIYLGDDSSSTVQKALEKGLFTIVDGMEGVNGKVFVSDTKVAKENGYDTVGMQPFLYFPAIMSSDGVYEITAKLKYENGTPVNSGTILPNGPMVDNYGNRVDIEVQEGTTVSYSEPDENGWVTMTFRYLAGDFRAVSFDIKPSGEGYTNNDRLFVAELTMKKAEDIVEDIIISSGHSEYNSIQLGDKFIIPNAISNGIEPIVVELTKPDGSSSTVNMRDEIVADMPGVYKIEYSSSEAKNTLVIIFETLTIDGENHVIVNDDNAQSIKLYSYDTLGFPYFNPYSDEFNAFSEDKYLISSGVGASESSDLTELVSDVEGANGQAVHMYTENLTGDHFSEIDFSAEVEAGKTYVLSAKLKLTRKNMDGFDFHALYTGEYFFSKENTADIDGNFYGDQQQVQGYLTTSNLNKLQNGDWFYYTKVITVPETINQGGENVQTTAMRFWFSLSALPQPDMQYDLWVDDVQVVEVKTIQSVNSIDDITTSTGLNEADLPLPSTVTVTLNDGSGVERPVIWQCSNYDQNTAGTYEFVGTIYANELITNPSNLTATISVITEASQELADYTKVEQAITKANSLNRNDYTNFYIVDQAINKVIYGLPKDRQSEVDQMALDIENAIANLIIRPDDKPTRPSRPNNGNDSDDNYDPLDKDHDGNVSCNEYYSMTGLEWSDKYNACIISSTGNLIITIPDTKTK